jgi:hypothetical protein
LKRKEALRAISKLVPRLAEEIQWQGWRNRIHLAFLETLALPSDSITRKEGMGKIKKMKTWYVQREFLIPLELAIWKSQCLQDMPPERECYLSWATMGWKDNKAQQWDSNARAIIVSLVQPFLFKV